MLTGGSPIHGNLHLYNLLVGGLEHLLFSQILETIISTDFHIFQRGGSTTNQVKLSVVWINNATDSAAERFKILNEVRGTHDIRAGLLGLMFHLMDIADGFLF